MTSGGRGVVSRRTVPKKARQERRAGFKWHMPCANSRCPEKQGDITEPRPKRPDLRYDPRTFSHSFLLDERREHEGRK
jgi:hypothetical protein